MRDWKQTVNEYKARDTFDDDVAAHRACQLAATASTLGTYAVGAVLLDDNGRVLSEGHNETFINGFRSDLHAEMVVLNKFETEHQNSIKPSTLTLVSSLEPCPMCTARLIYAGIGTVRYVCSDPHAGMVSRITSLPPKLKEITAALSQSWAPAKCSAELRHAAQQLWEQSRNTIDQQLVERGIGRDISSENERD